MPEQPHDPLTPAWLTSVFALSFWRDGKLLDPVTGLELYLTTAYEEARDRHCWSLDGVRETGLTVSEETFDAMCKGVVKEDGAVMIGDDHFHLVARGTEAVLVRV